MVVGTRSDLFPIRGIGHTADPVLVGTNTDFRLSCDCIHHDQSAIIATGCYAIVDRRERNSVNLDKVELIIEVRKCKLTQSEGNLENV